MVLRRGVPLGMVFAGEDCGSSDLLLPRLFESVSIQSGIHIGKVVDAVCGTQQRGVA